MKRRGPRSDLKRRRAGRGSGILPAGRPVVLVLGLAGAVLASPVAVAVATADPMVSATIFESGSPPTAMTKALSPDALAACPGGYRGPNPSLLVAARFRTPQPFPPTSSWSIGTVLGCLGLASNTVTGVEVQELTGAWEDPLTGGALSVGAPQEPVPLIYIEGSEMSYFRPQATPSDLNAGDQVNRASPLSLRVYTGPLLTVTVKPVPASPTAPVGATASFTAEVRDAQARLVDPTTLAYSWSLDGTASSQSPSFSQTFANAGRYTVAATVNDDNGGGGAGFVQVTVGSGQSATPGPEDTSTPGNTQQPGAGATGPQQSAGTIPGGAPGPRQPKATTPSSKASPSRKAATPPATAPKKTKAAPPAAAPTPASAPAPGPSAATPVTGPPPRVTPAGQGPVISGRLISNVTLLPPGASPLVKVLPETATAPPVQRSTRASILPTVAGALAVVLLLALGAGHQLRWRLRPIRRLVVG